MESLNSLTLSEEFSNFEAWRSTRIGKSRLPVYNLNGDLCCDHIPTEWFRLIIHRKHRQTLRYPKVLSRNVKK